MTPGSASRRDVLGLIAAGAGFSLLPRLARADSVEALALFGPPAGPSITLAHAVHAGMFDDLASNVTLTVWRNPDELRAGLTSGAMSVFVAPVQVVANLYNRGLGVRLVNVMTNGLLYVIATDPALTSFEAMAGKTLAVPFRNDTPDLILRRILSDRGLAPGSDLTVETTGSPIEAIQLVLAGRVDAALVPEPAVSAAIFRGSMSGTAVHRVIDIQQAWGAITGLGAALPQAGLAVTEDFLSENPTVVDALHATIEEATAEVVADPQMAADAAAPALGLPLPVIAGAIPFSNLVAVRASAARPTIEPVLSAISETSPEIIGGRLPDAALYL